MKNDNKPSIYNDRTTIGSPNELDEYGVWVKIEPQDLSSAAQTELVDSDALGFSADISGLDDMDLGIPDIEDLPDFDELEEQASAGGISSAISEDTVSENIDDDFDLPDISIGEPDSTEDEDDGNVFNFGDLTGASDNSAESTDSVNFLKPDETIEFPSLPDEAKETDDASDTVEFYDSTESNDSFQDISIDDFNVTPGPKSETAPVSAKPEPKTNSADLSNQLLMKIAEELASIRGELSSLKKEFSGLKSQSAAEEAAGKDFYDSEDDEKISLTGDELNNILNTADFTQESGADATGQLSESIAVREPQEIPDADSETLSINDLDMEINLDDETTVESVEDSVLDDIAMDDSVVFEQNFEEVDLSIDDIGITEEINDEQDFIDLDSEETLPDFNTDESVELKTIIEEGIEPMTPAPDPEDASYLAAEPNTVKIDDLPKDSFDPDFNDFLIDTSDEISEDISLDTQDSMDLDNLELENTELDLSDAVIDEPDLSADIQDNPIEEPSLDDISIDLDLTEMELGGDDPEETDLEDTDLEMVLPVDDFAEQEEELALPADDFDDDASSLISEAFVSAEAPEDELIPEEDFGIPGSEESAVPELEEVSGAANKPGENSDLPSNLKNELRTVLSYMDQLLDSLPDDKIEEFAQSDYYDTYKKLFKELGIV